MDKFWVVFVMWWVGVLVVVGAVLVLLLGGGTSRYYTSQHEPPGGWTFPVEDVPDEPCAIIEYAQKSHADVIPLVPSADEAEWHRVWVERYGIVLEEMGCE